MLTKETFALGITPIFIIRTCKPTSIKEYAQPRADTIMSSTVDEWPDLDTEPLLILKWVRSSTSSIGLLFIEKS